MDLNKEVLSKIVVFNKYAKYITEKNRRETFNEIVDRCKDMHKEHFKDKGEKFLADIDYMFDNFVKTKKVLPSMRSCQFAGKAVELNPARQYNCSYLSIDNIAAFPEAMFLLLSGTGVGFSVQKHHVEKLPPIKKPLKFRRFVIEDSIAGWADAVKVLCKAYLMGKSAPLFDYRDIREKGMPLITSGGKAPGAEPLRNCLHKIKMIFERKKDGEQLSTLECHDIMCHIADAVLSGGIRRAACISLFSMDDEEMLSCKAGNWWETNPQRGRANNSALVLRHRVKKDDFLKLWERIKASGSGEPGIYFSNNQDWGINPSLRAGTKVMTTDGIVPIETLDGKEFKVKNLNGEISKAKCWLSGKNKPLYKITLKGNHTYYATAEHEWPILKNGMFTKIPSSQLQAGNMLPILKQDSLFSGSLGDRDDGFFIGWHLGDGWTTHRNDNFTQHGLVVSKKDCEYGIDKILLNYLNKKLNSNVTFLERKSTLELNTVSNNWNDLLSTFEYSKKENGLPKKIWTECSEEFRKGIIDGLISSDGCVSTGDKRITFTSKHIKLAEDISELLGFYGIKTNIQTKKTKLNGKEFVSFNVRIDDNSSLKHFIKLFKLTCGHKQERLNSYKFKETDNELIEIKSVELSELKEDVWDISVFDETHCFQIAHCITGNCCEIALRSNQMCNLTTINASDIKDQDDLEARCAAASFIGTLQAAYTDFYYLRDTWKKTCEKEALLGVSMTGIASNEYVKCDLKKAAEVVKKVNSEVAGIIGINPAARATCVKPEGTASLVLGTSSGIHSWFAPFYVRRMKVGKNEEIYQYLSKTIPQLLEDDVSNPTKDAFVKVPIAAPEGAVTSDVETPLQLLERIKTFSDNWIKSGHTKGDNTHNVSATVYIKDHEWESVAEWMWNHRDSYNGLSVLPFDGGTYTQTPFERITKEQYDELSQYVKDIDLSNVFETENVTDLKGEIACGGGGQCELTF